METRLYKVWKSFISIKICRNRIPALQKRLIGFLSAYCFSRKKIYQLNFEGLD